MSRREAAHEIYHHMDNLMLANRELLFTWSSSRLKSSPPLEELHLVSFFNLLLLLTAFYNTFFILLYFPASSSCSFFSLPYTAPSSYFLLLVLPVSYYHFILYPIKDTSPCPFILLTSTDPSFFFLILIHSTFYKLFEFLLLLHATFSYFLLLYHILAPYSYCHLMHSRTGDRRPPNHNCFKMSGTVLLCNRPSSYFLLLPLLPTS